MASMARIGSVLPRCTRLRHSIPSASSQLSSLKDRGVLLLPYNPRFDISSKDYSPQENQGLEYETVMGRIHAIMSDGTVVTDVEAFRKLYEAVGIGWVYALTKFEPVATIANAIYGVWAKYRLQITGRPPLEVVLENRRKLAEGCSDDKGCKM